MLISGANSCTSCIIHNPNKIIEIFINIERQSAFAKLIDQNKLNILGLKNNTFTHFGNSQFLLNWFNVIFSPSVIRDSFITLISQNKELVFIDLEQQSGHANKKPILTVWLHQMHVSVSAAVKMGIKGKKHNYCRFSLVKANDKGHIDRLYIRPEIIIIM